jgi:hypothetical protein
MTLDPKIVADGVVARECYALVRAPVRGRKTRFPEQSVTPLTDAAQALAAADAARGLYAARVLGPSRSSEGVRLYYLLEWLEEA